MFLPIPLQSFTNRIISHRTFLFYPRVANLIFYNEGYTVYTGNKYKFSYDSMDNLVTTVNHSMNLNTRLFTTSFETVVTTFEGVRMYREYIHLTPVKPILKLENEINFPNDPTDLYVAHYTLVKNQFNKEKCTNVIEYTLTDEYSKIVNDFLDTSITSLK